MTEFWRLVEARADRTPDAPMLLEDGGRSLSFGALRTAAEEVASGLWDLGITAGSRVTWQLPTTLEAVVLMAALARLGVVQTPIVPNLRHAEVRQVVEETGAQLLVVPRSWRSFDHAAMAAEVVDEEQCQILVCDLDDQHVDLALPRGDVAALPGVPADDGGTRWIFYSSGTTGRPKGARHNDSAIALAARSMLDGAEMRADDTFPVPFPIGHVGGPAIIAGQLRVGFRIVLVPQWDATSTPRQPWAAELTVLASAPPFFQAYLDAQRETTERLTPRLRVVCSGGAPVPSGMHDEVRELLGGAGIISVWGLTECPMAVCSSLSDPAEVLAGTIGRPGPDVEVRIVGPDGAVVPVGQEGELHVRAPQSFLGYVDAALDAEVLHADGWFRSGDLGVQREDGILRVTGRRKDVIIRNAENISALEVEGVLERHPSVREVAVIGVPDERTGERCCAVIVLAEGVAELSAAQLLAHCRHHGLATYKAPERLETVAALPRNASGKVLKGELRDLLRTTDQRKDHEP